MPSRGPRCNRVAPRFNRVDLGSKCRIPRAGSRTRDSCASISRDDGSAREGIRAPNTEPAAPRDRIAISANAFAPPCDRIATSAGRSRRVKSARMLPPDQTTRPRERAAGHDGEQRRHRRVRDGSAAERHGLERECNDLRIKRNNLELTRNGFSARAIAGTPDAFSSHATGTRRVRVGSPVFSSSSRAPRCPAILRPMQKEEV